VTVTERTRSPPRSALRSYCLDQWVATGFAAGPVTAPRVMRFVAGIMATVAVSDFLQIAYKASESQLGD
jgi:hypothetical protein